MKFTIGQKVCVSKDIRGWFDRSMKSCIPAGTVGKIIDCDYLSHDKITYVVQFNDEFGIQLLPEENLF